jgi:hypothetical protein
MIDGRAIFAALSLSTSLVPQVSSAQELERVEALLLYEKSIEQTRREIETLESLYPALRGAVKQANDAGETGARVLEAVKAANQALIDLRSERVLLADLLVKVSELKAHQGAAVAPSTEPAAGR